MNFIEQYIAKLRPEFQGAGKVAEAYAQLALDRLDRIVANTESSPNTDYGQLYPQFHVPVAIDTVTPILEVPSGETWALTALAVADPTGLPYVQYWIDGKPLMMGLAPGHYNQPLTPIRVALRSGVVLTALVTSTPAPATIIFAQCERLTIPRPHRDTRGALGAILRPIQIEGTADDVDQTLERHAQ